MNQFEELATTPLLKETCFTLWPPGADQRRLPNGAPASMAKIFFATTLLQALQESVPEFAGSFGPERIPEVGVALNALSDGETCISHRLGLSVMSYGEVEGQLRMVVRVTCLDPPMPIVIEADLPIGLYEVAEEWDVEGAAFTVVHPAGTDPVDHPLVVALAGFMDCTEDDIRDALDDEAENPSSITVFAQVQDFLDDEIFRTKLACDGAISKTRKFVESEAQAAKDQSKRDVRRLTRHNESLQVQLDTSKAVGDRQRVRADDLERRLRELTKAGAGPQSVAPATPANGDVPRSELEAALDQVRMLTLQLDQTRGELDGVREQLHQANLRHQALLATEEQGGEVASITDIPTSFGALHAWIAARLDPTRVLIHPKAVRAARKSVFRDVGLAYRALQAINDWYWPMKINGDATAGAQWNAFLVRERLSCGPTGAALDNSHTRESYHVSYQGRRYPLDLHLQGSSSRKEEDAFRLYFHASRELGKILIGHFPTHLPNTHT